MVEVKLVGSPEEVHDEAARFFLFNRPVAQTTAPKAEKVKKETAVDSAPKEKEAPKEVEQKAAPKEETKSEATIEYTLDHVAAVLSKVANAYNDRTKAVELLKKYGATKGREVKPADFEAFVKEAEALVAAKKG